MKRLSSHDKIRLIRLLLYRHRKLLQKKYNLEEKKVYYSSIRKMMPSAPLPSEALPKPTFTKTNEKRPLLRIEIITPPTDLSLRRNYAEVAGFIQHFRHWLYNRPRPTKRQIRRVDFTKIQHVSPSAALVLASELDRWQSTNRMKLVPYDPEAWNPEVGRIFYDLGLFDLLGIECPDTIKYDDSPNITKVLKYVRQKVVDPQRLGEMLTHLTEIAGEIEARNFIYDGLIEALKNAKQHAYIENRWYGVALGTSWMTGAYNPRQKRLTAAVYDCGVGIPETLPYSSQWEKIKDSLGLFEGNESSRRIAAALKVGRSRTGEAQRGNGLPTMMRLIDQIGGELRILSGYGEVIYYGNDKIRSKALPGAIGGTLIEWRLQGEGCDDD